jgi:hypothetical protein
MGLHLLDFHCVRAGNGARFVFFQVPKGSAHRRGTRGLFGHVPIAGAPTGCVALLCGDVCLRRLRTGYCRLDVEFFAPVPRFGSPYHRCGSGFLVLGLANGWLLGWNVIAENIRQPQSAYRCGYRGSGLSVQRFVWARKGFRNCFSGSRTVCLSDVAYSGVARAQFCHGVPRLVRRHFGNRNHRWRSSAGNYWANWRLCWPA